MSKMDALRAMREARYEQDRARAGGGAQQTTAPKAAKTPKTPKTPAAKPAKASAAGSAPGAEPDAEPDARCGHRNMSGRTCTRDRGHAAKSHRYS